MDSIGLLKDMVLIFALTMDSFVVSFAYGVSKTKLTLPLIVLMNLIMSSLLGAAILAGNWLQGLLPEGVTGKLGFLLLFCIGSYRLGAYFFQKEKEEKTEVIKKLSMLEGLGLAVVLSLDSLAVGIGTGLIQSGQLFLVFGSFLAGVLMMLAGWRLGHFSRQALKKDLSWISGVCLLLLAIGAL